MKQFGIVGSREAKKESLEIAKILGRIFSSQGINVISGLARGIDKFAHLGALEKVPSKTIAVLGNGVDDENIYPYENKRVFERIIESEGAIISEYPIGTKPIGYNFPYRNRIISGLSNKIIVVQASKKSGSLITVDYALEQGKDVYVYKSPNIDDEYFSGNKMLIEEGARII
jgi:DNA processing protein